MNGDELGFRVLGLRKGFRAVGQFGVVVVVKEEGLGLRLGRS